MPTDLDFSTVAGLYSQFTGVLAGFAFSGLITIISIRTATSSNTTRFSLAYLPLVAAFFGLVLTSLNYAIVASDKTNSLRTAALEVSAAVGFAAAGVMLVLSVLAILRAVSADSAKSNEIDDRTTRATEILFGMGTCPMISLLFVGAVRDFTISKYGLRSSEVGLTYSGWGIFALTMIIGILYGFHAWQNWARLGSA